MQQLVQTAPLDPALALRQSELAELLLRLSGKPGLHDTAIAGLQLAQSDRPTLPMPVLHKPSLCIIAQGSKEVRLGDETYTYDPLNFLVISVTLPVSGQVTQATPETPYLSLRLDIDPTVITSLIAEAGCAGQATPGSQLGLYVERIEMPLLDAVLRLLRLLDTPADIAMLSPLILREIFYRLLRGSQGRHLQDIAIADSQSHRISRAIEWLNKHYDRPLRIEALAREVNLSASTLHHRFKAVTALSPLQYQKQLRLQEARRLMISEGLEASAASYRVGYESPSQFSREYSRLFGAPPLRDMARLRSSA